MSDGEPDSDAQRRTALLECEAQNTALQQQLTALEAERWQLEERCRHLRRLLIAVLPPDAVYQEARDLARKLRGGG